MILYSISAAMTLSYLLRRALEADIAKLIIDEFDKLIPYHYSVLDRHRGYIRIKDRRGKICDF